MPGLQGSRFQVIAAGAIAGLVSRYLKQTPSEAERSRADASQILHSSPRRA